MNQLDYAITQHQGGKLDAALVAYQALLRANPRDVNVLNLMGVLQFQRGQFQEGVKLLRKCLQLKPDFAQAHYNLGKGLLQSGKVADAIAALKRAAALAPQFSEAHLTLSEAYGRDKRFDLALLSAEHALAIDPRLVPAWVNRAVALYAAGNYDESLVSCQKAVQLAPQFSPALLNRGRALRALGRLGAAVDDYRAAVAAYAQDPKVLCEYCELLLDSGRPEEALPIAGHIQSLGDPEGVASLLAGLCHQALENLDAAADAFREAVAANRKSPRALSALGEVQRQLGRFEEAEPLLREAMALAPSEIAARFSLATLCADLCRFDEAEQLYREVLAHDPAHLPARSALLFCHTYADRKSAIDCVDEAREYGRVVAEIVGKPYADWCVDPAPRILRVGVVSGDLREHSVGYFLEDVVARMDKTRVALYAYPTHRLSDDLTLRLIPHFAGWRHLSGKSDAEAAALIREDGIHVLIDLAGHSANARLPVFALKPAPVQCSWLGYCATTGLASIDYYLADDITLPESIESQFVERVWRLPGSYLCFSRPKIEVPVVEPPMLRNGYPTFASFNNLSKIGSRVIRAWSSILNALPESCLLLKAKQLQEPRVRERLLADFAAQGVNPARLQLLGQIADRAQHHALYGQVDIALDTFPYNGVTTTVEALWMGVPVLTFAGDRFLARQGAGILSAAGLADWIAADESDLVARACRLASDPAELATLRCDMRSRLASSPLLDPERFANRLTQALWSMWESRGQ